MKRLEAQKELKFEPQKDDSAASEVDQDVEVRTPMNHFAMVLDPRVHVKLKFNQQEESDEEETVVPDAPIVPSSTKKSKSKKKKKKSTRPETLVSLTPDKSHNGPAPSDLDDLDRAIQEISLKYGETVASSTSSTHPTLSQKFSLLTISPRFLDADIELRKLFGKVVDAEARESRRQPIHGVPARVVNRIKATQSQRKRTLMKPKDEWQLFTAYNRNMLSMDIVSKDEVTKFKFVHSKGYQDAQMQFYIAALGGDGNVLMGLLQERPFHVDTW
jgi:hypothetical protein